MWCVVIPRSELPEASKGDWSIQRFTISEAEAARENLHYMEAGSMRRMVKPGTYTRLVRYTPTGDVVVMSDTDAEIRDHQHFVWKAEGNVLVTGLGLGLVVNALLLKPAVEHVTVVEISDDVIYLVAPYLWQAHGHERLYIDQGDAFHWLPPWKNEKFDYAWHDIWTDINPDNLPQIRWLKQHYANRMKEPGRQKAWVEDELRWRRSYYG